VLRAGPRGSRQRIIGALAKRPSTTTRMGRILPMILPVVAGCQSTNQRLTAALLSPPSQTLVYMCRSLSCPPPPQSTPPPPSAHLASLLPLHRRPVHTPPSRATPPAQPRHPLLHPPLAPHLVARSKGGSRRDGGLPPDATS
jgi:hypothetical protein